jgi:hypothetical protein
LGSEPHELNEPNELNELNEPNEPNEPRTADSKHERRTQKVVRSRVRTERIDATSVHERRTRKVVRSRVVASELASDVPNVARKVRRYVHPWTPDPGPWVLIPVVACATANEHAAALLELAKQVTAVHET